MKITLAKALKLKNRFGAKISTVSELIAKHNSVMVGQDRPVDVNTLLEKRTRLVDVVINLKTAINAANVPVQQTIYLLSELKGELTFLKSVDTTSGKQMKESWRGDGTVVDKDCVLEYSTIQGLIEQTEVDIDANQDTLDKHNHSVEIEIEDGVTNLLKG
jgi:hypothetical protein